MTVNVDYINIHINDVATTMTSSGRIGYRADGQTGGLGFNYMGDGTLLYEAGLMIGTSTSKVSSVVRGTTAGASDNDFQSVVTVHTVTPSAVSEFDVDGTINDAPAATGPLPVMVENKGYAWSSAGNTKYVIIEYNIHNTGSATLSNLYAGIFADWDIDAATYGSDRASFDAVNRMGYAYYSGTAGKYAGIKLLSHTAGVNHYAIDNIGGGGGGMDISDGFDTNEKYTALSTSRANAGVAGTGNDVCDVVSSGPFTIAAGDSVKVAFALIAGDSLPDLQTSAVNAQTMYDGVVAAASVQNLGDENNTMIVYPNPANSASTVLISIAQAGNVSLELFDMLGRSVKTIASERMAAGQHVMNVDVASLQNGMYYYSLTLNGKKYTSKLMIAR